MQKIEIWATSSIVMPKNVDKEIKNMVQIVKKIIFIFLISSGRNWVLTNAPLYLDFTR